MGGPRRYRCPVRPFASLSSSRRGVFRGTLALLVGLTLSTGGCDAKEDESTPPLVHPAEGAPHPILLSRAGRHGPSLWWRDHALQLAVDRGLTRVGGNSSGPLLPIADVDDGFHSASVTFYRWLERDAKKMGPTRNAEYAQRWLVIPILLRPDRILENEQFSDYLTKDSDRAREIDAILVAGEALSADHPGGRWHMHPYREGTHKAPQRKIRTRVYAMGLTPESPDVELVVADAKSNAAAFVEAKQVIHEGGAWEATEMKLAVNAPNAMTLARVLSRQLLAQRVTVHGKDGSVWSIDAESGEVENLSSPDYGESTSESADASAETEVAGPDPTGADPAAADAGAELDTADAADESADPDAAPE